jgi:hypothetical protein
MRTTKKPSDPRGRKQTQEELAQEYRFDYEESRPNRFAGEIASDAVVVVLDSDVAEVFRDSKQVNGLLRATIAAVNKPRRRKVG